MLKTASILSFLSFILNGYTNALACTNYLEDYKIQWVERAAESLLNSLPKSSVVESSVLEAVLRHTVRREILEGTLKTTELTTEQTQVIPMKNISNLVFKTNSKLNKNKTIAKQIHSVSFDLKPGISIHAKVETNKDLGDNPKVIQWYKVQKRTILITPPNPLTVIRDYLNIDIQLPNQEKEIWLKAHFTLPFDFWLSDEKLDSAIGALQSSIETEQHEDIHNLILSNKHNRIEVTYHSSDYDSGKKPIHYFGIQIFAGKNSLLVHEEVCSPDGEVLL